MKRIVLLGASGSIGMQTIDVVLQHKDLFEIVAFGVGRNIQKAREILELISVDTIAVEKEEDAIVLRKEYPNLTVYSGDEGLVQLAKYEDYDVLVNALVGFVGFMPTLKAIECKHDIALANKETLVVGGALIDRALKENGVSLYPIDSEHSAIFQCLQGNRIQDVERLIVTASGGSFRDLSRDALENVTVEQALAHPNWAMGAKITIDSATMMNKGFEVMEAHWLFDLPYDKIDVIMHKESVVHSMVEYIDHSIMAQLGNPDMRLPIQYALSWPNRLSLQEEKPFNLADIALMHFEAPNYERYPLLKLAYEVGKKGGNLPAVMNAANEVANLAFREGKIPFLAIEDVVIQTVDACTFNDVNTVDDLIAANAFGKEMATKFVEEVSK